MDFMFSATFSIYVPLIKLKYAVSNFYKASTRC